MSTLLKERIKYKDSILHHKSLLIEALDVSDLKKADVLIKQFRDIFGESLNKLPELESGITISRKSLVDANQSILDRFDSFDNFKERLKSKAAGKIASKLADVFSFIKTLITGAKTFESIANSVIVSSNKSDLTLSSLPDYHDIPINKLKSVMENGPATTDKDSGTTTFTSESIDINLNDIASMIIKALKPKGIFSTLMSFVSKEGIPYVNDKQLTKEFLSLTYSELIEISQRANKTQTNDNDSSENKAQEKLNNKKQTKNSESKNDYQRKVDDLIKNMEPNKREILYQALLKHRDSK